MSIPAALGSVKIAGALPENSSSSPIMEIFYLAAGIVKLSVEFHDVRDQNRKQYAMSASIIYPLFVKFKYTLEFNYDEISDKLIISISGKQS